MAREYGKTPTEIMDIPGLNRAKKFHLDFDIFAATSQFINEKREEHMESAGSGGRVASPSERKEMARQQQQRAKQRESMQQAGMEAPSPQGQVAQLENVLEERAGTKSKDQGEPHGR